MIMNLGQSSNLLEGSHSHQGFTICVHRALSPRFRRYRKENDMRLWINSIAILLLLIGAVWTLQGANVLGGSFMTGQPTWLYIGIALSIVGLGILVWNRVR